MDGLWFVLLGLGAGTYGVLVGAGGGFIIVPVLLIFFDVEPGIAAGTSLALVALNSMSGALVYRRAGFVDRRSGYLFVAAAVPGSVLAPFALTAVAGDLFRAVFGALLVVVAVQTALRPARESEEPRVARAPRWLRVRSRHIETRTGEVYDYELSEALVVFVNFVLGFVSSFFGTGGGFLRTPILVNFFGFPVRVAVATSIFALAFYATAGAAAHVGLGHVDWYPTFVWIGAGLITGGQLGARMAPRLRGVWIIRMLVVVLLLLGVRLIVQGIQG